MPKLMVERIAKSYDGNPAVREISFSVASGEVLAVCGENGAGKSTLMKMLSGAVVPDSGRILIDGEPVAIARPADAMALGIRIVYQELSLLPHLSVAENMLLGRMPLRGFASVIDWPEANRIAARVLTEFGFPEIDPETLVRDLPVSRQQIVEIAKALVGEPSVLILDEPTAVLSALETERLFAKVRRLATNGTTVLYISHRLEEIFQIAGAFVVLKDGASVLQGRIADVDEARLIEAMVGRPLAAIFPPRDRVAGRTVLEVDGLGLAGTFESVGFSVAAGEILGLFGLVGAGRTDVARALFGAHPADRGRILIDGVEVSIRSPREAVRLGIAMITEDRKGDGLALDDSVVNNAMFACFNRIAHRGVIDGSERDRLMAEQVRQLAIRTPGTDRPVRQLSGGNQQKVVLAKWLLASGIRLFIFDEPTRGVDIATKVEIYRIIAGLAAAGAAILLISSEMPEVIGISDRILVMREGRLAANLTPDAFSMETLFRYAAGLAQPA